MQKYFKKQTVQIGIFLLSAFFAGSPLYSQSESDSAGVFKNKKLLDAESVSIYGKTVSKRYSTTSVSIVSGDEIRSINTPLLGNTLEGRLSGLMVSPNGNAPGIDNPSLQIRGVQTFLNGAAGITVLVDGFETDWSTIHPDEIESIQVLKDAASLAIYGNSGANGILYIKTKRGTDSDEAKITFNSRVSFQQPTVMPEFLSKGDFAEMYNTALVSDGKSINSGPFHDVIDLNQTPNQTLSVVDLYKQGTYPDLYSNVDWYKEMLKSSAIAQDYTLAISGGQEGARYHVMLGYMDTPGLYAGTDGTNNSNWDYNKYMSRINLDFDITDWLRASLNTRGTMIQAKQQYIDHNTLWTSMGSFMPFNVKTPSGAWGGTQGYPTNPVAQLKQQGYQTENSRFIDADLKLVADLDFIVDGLSAFGQSVFSNYYFWTYNKSRGLSYEELFPRTDTIGLFTRTVKGDLNKSFAFNQSSGSQWNRYTWVAGLELDRQIGEGKLYAQAMHLRTLYVETLDENEQPYASMNTMGRINYNLKNKYIAEVNLSYSGSDNYAPGKRMGLFPAVSGAWVISNESFLSSSTAINFLKLRASYGIVGNNRIGDLGRFPFYDYYSQVNGAYRIGGAILNMNEGTLEPSSYPNPDATWEKAYKTNLGIDAQIFKNLSFSADYFFENREDIFVNPANYLSVVIGNRYSYVNLGSAKNNGYELELTYSNSGSKLSYYASTRLSHVSTEIIEAKESPKTEDYLYRKGQAINQPFVLEANGFLTDADILAIQAGTQAFPTFGSVKPGDVKYIDQNGDLLIDDNDEIPVGNAYPTLLYSFDFGVAYKGFDLSVFMYGISGRTISLLDNQIVPLLDNVLPTQWVKDNYWTPERGDAAQFPRLTTESNPNNYRASTLWQRDGSSFRIKNIELGYTMPENMKLGVRIYINAVNPFIFHSITEMEMDPEINDSYLYPQMKSYNLGVKLTF